jgi:hypothetical protein
MLVELQTTMPYARNEQGMAGVFIKNANNSNVFISHIAAIAICACFGITAILLFLLAFAITYI